MSKEQVAEDAKKAPTTADVQETVRRLHRDLDGKSTMDCSPSDIALSGALAFAESVALPLAEDRDRYAAEVELLRAHLDAILMHIDELREKTNLAAADLFSPTRRTP
jgi:hypothetical protein